MSYSLHKNNVIEKGRILHHVHVNVCKRGEDMEEGQGICLFHLLY